MHRLQIKIDTGGLRCALHSLALLNAGKFPLACGTQGFSSAPCIGLEEVLLHPQWAGTAKIYQSFQLIIITAHVIKSPIVIYNHQISRSKLMRQEMRKKHLRTSKWRMEHRGVKGSACGYVRLLWEPKPQSRLPTSYNSAIHQTYNTCKSFPLCFPHFFSPSFPTPRVHLLTLHIIQMWLPKPWTTLKIIQKINFLFLFLKWS